MNLLDIEAWKAPAYSLQPRLGYAYWKIPGRKLPESGNDLSQGLHAPSMDLKQMKFSPN